MLAIGFANKYYTLWEVTTNVYENRWERYTETVYTYVERISRNLEDARNAYPEAELLSILENRTAKRFSVIGEREKINTHLFSFGKYCGQEIATCTDGNYMRWMFENTDDARKKNILNRLNQLGFHCEKCYRMNDEGTVEEYYSMYSPENWAKKNENLQNRKAFMDVVLSNKPLEVFFERNLKVDNEGNGYYRHNGTIIKFNDVAVNWYMDCQYALPKQNGKGKRIKNKTVLITKYDWSMIDVDSAEVTVKEFKVAL